MKAQKLQETLYAIEQEHLLMERVAGWVCYFQGKIEMSSKFGLDHVVNDYQENYQAALELSIRVQENILELWKIVQSELEKLCEVE